MNTEQNATTPTTAEARLTKKPEYLPVITSSGRITVAPVLGWDDIGTHLHSTDHELGPDWMQEKAAKLRALARDLLSQAETIETELRTRSLAA